MNIRVSLATACGLLGSLASPQSSSAQSLDELSRPPAIPNYSLPPGASTSVLVAPTLSLEEKTFLLSAVTLKERRVHDNLTDALTFISRMRAERTEREAADQIQVQAPTDVNRTERFASSLQSHELSIARFQEFLAAQETLNRAALEATRELSARTNDEVARQMDAARKESEKLREGQARAAATTSAAKDSASASSDKPTAVTENTRPAQQPSSKKSQAASGPVKEDPPSRTDTQRNDRIAISRMESPDGSEGELIGVENSYPELRAFPVIVTLGIGSDTESEMAGMLAISKKLHRPVLGIKNASAREAGREIAPFFAPLLGPNQPFPESEDPETVELRRLGLRKVGDFAGLAFDFGRASYDFIAPARFAIEEATATNERIVLRRLLDGKPVDLIDHSQGGIIAQNALLNVNRVLGELVDKGVFTEAERSKMLSSVNVYVLGSPALPSRWPGGIVTHPYDNPGDPVPLLGFHPMQVPLSEHALEKHFLAPDYLDWLAKNVKNPNQTK